MFRFDATQAPGVYRLVLTAAQTSRTHHFVVGLDSAESDLTRLRDPVSERLAALTGLTFFDTPDDLQAALAVESPGREIWRWLAAGVFVLLLAEALLTRAIARSRQGEASDAVDYGDGLAPALQ